MPIYEYSCGECGHDFEKIQKISDAPIRKCPSCGRLKARRLISRTSFVLKGEGWYVTDYPSKDREAAMKSESGGNGEAEKSTVEAGDGKKSTAEAGDGKKSTVEAGDGKKSTKKEGDGKKVAGKAKEGKSAESKTASSKKTKSDSKAS